MKYLYLVWAALRRRPARTFLTVLSVTTAFFLFGVLQGINVGIDQVFKMLNVAHLDVMSRVSLNDPLPIYGASLAWLFFNGNTVSTISGGGGLAQIAFKLRVGPDLVAVGIVWACVVGLIGGLLPAIRAARLPVATALRAM